jgi:hypothetical protein
MKVSQKSKKSVLQCASQFERFYPTECDDGSVAFRTEVAACWYRLSQQDREAFPYKAYLTAVYEVLKDRNHPMTKEKKDT